MKCKCKRGLAVLLAVLLLCGTPPPTASPEATASPDPTASATPAPSAAPEVMRFNFDSIRHNATRLFPNRWYTGNKWKKFLKA